MALTTAQQKIQQELTRQGLVQKGDTLQFNADGSAIIRSQPKQYYNLVDGRQVPQQYSPKLIRVDSEGKIVSVIEQNIYLQNANRKGTNKTYLPYTSRETYYQNGQLKRQREFASVGRKSGIGERVKLKEDRMFKEGQIQQEKKYEFEEGKKVSQEVRAYEEGRAYKQTYEPAAESQRTPRQAPPELTKQEQIAYLEVGKQYASPLLKEKISKAQSSLVEDIGKSFRSSEKVRLGGKQWEVDLNVDYREPEWKEYNLKYGGYPIPSKEAAEFSKLPLDVRKQKVTERLIKDLQPPKMEFMVKPQFKEKTTFVSQREIKVLNEDVISKSLRLDLTPMQAYKEFGVDIYPSDPYVTRLQKTAYNVALIRGVTFGQDVELFKKHPIIGTLAIVASATIGGKAVRAGGKTLSSLTGLSPKVSTGILSSGVLAGFLGIKEYKEPGSVLSLPGMISTGPQVAKIVLLQKTVGKASGVIRQFMPELKFYFAPGYKPGLKPAGRTKLITETLADYGFKSQSKTRIPTGDIFAKSTTAIETGRARTYGVRTSATNIAGDFTKQSKMQTITVNYDKLLGSITDYSKASAVTTAKPGVKPTPKPKPKIELEFDEKGNLKKVSKITFRYKTKEPEPGKPSGGQKQQTVQQQIVRTMQKQVVFQSSKTQQATKQLGLTTQTTKQKNKQASLSSALSKTWVLSVPAQTSKIDQALSQAARQKIFQIPKQTARAAQAQKPAQKAKQLIKQIPKMGVLQYPKMAAKQTAVQMPKQAAAQRLVQRFRFVPYQTLKLKTPTPPPPKLFAFKPGLPNPFGRQPKKKKTKQSRGFYNPSVYGQWLYRTAGLKISKAPKFTIGAGIRLPVVKQRKRRKKSKRKR